MKEPMYIDPNKLGLTWDPEKAKKSIFKRHYDEENEKRQQQLENDHQSDETLSQLAEEWSALAFAAGFESTDALNQMFEDYHAYAPYILEVMIHGGVNSPVEAKRLIDEKGSAELRQYINKLNKFMDQHHRAPPFALNQTDWAKINRATTQQRKRPTRKTRADVYKTYWNQVYKTEAEGPPPPLTPEQDEAFLNMIEEWNKNRS